MIKSCLGYARALPFLVTALLLGVPDRLSGEDAQGFDLKERLNESLASNFQVRGAIQQDADQFTFGKGSLLFWKSESGAQFVIEMDVEWPAFQIESPTEINLRIHNKILSWDFAESLADGAYHHLAVVRTSIEALKIVRVLSVFGIRLQNHPPYPAKLIELTGCQRTELRLNSAVDILYRHTQQSGLFTIDIYP